LAEGDTRFGAYGNRHPLGHEIQDLACKPRIHQTLILHLRQSALSDLESKMDDLDSRLHSVQSSCGYEFSINRMSSLEAAQHRQEAARRRLCASYKGFIGLGMTPDNVLQMCKANMDVQWCKVCLGLK
jgi:hypothetical protein